MMIDRYLPALGTFVLTLEEQDAVSAALASDDPWSWSPGGAQSVAIRSVKKKIRDFHLERHSNKCCYCRMNLKGVGPFMSDSEHILPKSSKFPYKHLSYEIWNLGIACKRCNMAYKRSKTDFFSFSEADASPLQKGANYQLVHPNFDLYREHLSRSAVEENDIVIVKYTVMLGSAKGEYTYSLFNLRELEVGSFDEAQGLAITTALSATAQSVRLLADSFGQ